MISRIATLSLLAALPSCLPREETATSARMLADPTGRQVALPHDPRHVLSLCTSATDTMMRIGEGGRLAGIDEFSRIVPGTEGVPVLGKGGALSHEQVLARKIDLAFLWWYQDDAADLLDSAGVPVVRIRCSRVAEIPATVRLIGQCLGNQPAADRLAAGVEHDLAGLSRPAPNSGPTVYLELYSAFKTAGRDSYLNDLIELAGGRNIAATACGPVLLSAEQVLAADPDRIVVIDDARGADAFASRPGMEGLSAVRHGHVHSLDRRALIAGAGIAEGVAALQCLLENGDRSATARHPRSSTPNPDP